MKQCPEVKYMMMLELVCAVAILAIISTAFFMTMNMMNKAESNFVQKHRALFVLDNTLERIEFMDDRTPEKVKKIFDDEYSRSQLYGVKRVTPLFKVENGLTELGFVDDKNRTICSVSVKTE